MSADMCGCGASWTGLAYAHCAVCHTTYATVRLFDLHRDGGECYELEGVVEFQGVWNTTEGHQKAYAKAQHFRKSRS
jgi:formate dehydrogenase maturation protein FdhE